MAALDFLKILIWISKCAAVFMMLCERKTEALAKAKITADTQLAMMATAI